MSPGPASSPRFQVSRIMRHPKIQKLAEEFLAPTGVPVPRPGLLHRVMGSVSARRTRARSMRPGTSAPAGRTISKVNNVTVTSLQLARGLGSGGLGT